MDAIPVEIVVEATSACPDRAKAQAALADALASARAPKRAGLAKTWIVRFGVADESKTKTATARILDDAGTTVAERSLTDRTACAPLARALGAWAALVVDDELARARDAAEGPPAPAAPNPEKHEEKPLAPVKLAPTDWRSPDDPDYVAPNYGRAWTLEMGLMTYVRDGLIASSGVVGGSGFLNFEVSPSWFVRPSLAVGASTAAATVDGVRTTTYRHVGFRTDFCRRIPGNYIDRRGLELDLCAFGDLSGVTPGGVRVSGGPTAAMRGEIGANASLELRVSGGYNLTRAPFKNEAEAPMVYALGEVGVSWRFR